MQDDEITKLLRLKRFEQPPPAYFEDFLQEFKDRQRAQLLREPAWRIAWDRLVAYFGEQLPARLGYGLASTAVLVTAGIMSINILETHPAAVMASSTPVREPAKSAQFASFNLSNSSPIQLQDIPTMAGSSARASSPPRYVMDGDVRPVSYEQAPSSF